MSKQYTDAQCASILTPTLKTVWLLEYSAIWGLKDWMNMQDRSLTSMYRELGINVLNVNGHITGNNVQVGGSTSFKTFMNRIFSIWPDLHKEAIWFYNITKAKRALWLVNLASTICPWVYAADVCANVYKANPLTDIVSKVMVDVLLPEMRNRLHSCVKMKSFIELLVCSRLSWLNFRALVFSSHVRLHEHFFVM